MTAARLAEMMLELQAKGAHNINLVTPTHYVPQFLEALSLAAARGLRLPIVYNTSGYDSMETLRLLDGIVDIYLPDAKYADDASGNAPLRLHRVRGGEPGRAAARCSGRSATSWTSTTWASRGAA